MSKPEIRLQQARRNLAAAEAASNAGRAMAEAVYKASLAQAPLDSETAAVDALRTPEYEAASNLLLELVDKRDAAVQAYQAAEHVFEAFQTWTAAVQEMRKAREAQWEALIRAGSQLFDELDQEDNWEATEKVATLACDIEYDLAGHCNNTGLLAAKLGLRSHES